MTTTTTKKKAAQKDDQPAENITAKKYKFRDLRADEIEVRLAQVKDNEATLLLYKDARCDMNILDETVGPGNWCRDHKEIRGVLFCTLGIRARAGGDWVYKTDCGTQSNMEPEKGAASDSFKRAAFNWGIGRELYTGPRIKTKVCKFINGRCFDSFSVEKIRIEDKKITALAIWNNTLGRRAYAWTKESGECSVE